MGFTRFFDPFDDPIAWERDRETIGMVPARLRRTLARTERLGDSISPHLPTTPPNEKGFAKTPPTQNYAICITQFA